METFGIVLVEAMAFGVPIISTSTGAAEELLGDGLAGEILASSDAMGLETAIRGLIAQPQLRARMSANGRSRFLRDFDLTKNSKRLARLIRGTNPTD
jgi:phosphatidylinositol alpha-mannosyltransferase